MASLPPQSSSLQRQRDSSQAESSPSDALEGNPLQQTRRPNQPQAKESEDSHTILLNKPSSSKPAGEDEQSHTPQTVQVKPSLPDEEPRKCWICFEDETEDNKASSTWRSPCPCALVAHESCLLDWVADLEAPKPRGGTRPSPKIECPQCKAKIIISRPRSPIVEAYQAVERAAERMVAPGVLITLAGTLYTGCWMHGASSVFLIFGVEDGKHMLGISGASAVSTRWNCGLPLVPVVLVLSRTRLLDNFLPVLPMLFFASQSPLNESLDLSLWPPSAAMTIAALPYLRGAYNEIYKRLFDQRMRKWIREVQPRAEENSEGPAATDDQNAPQGENQDGGEGEDMFELNVELEIFDEEQEEEERGDANDQAAPEQQPANPGAAGQANNAQNPGHNHNHEQAIRQIPLVITATELAGSFIGALAFPAISAAVGEILWRGLPGAWTAAPTLSASLLHRRRPGLLQTRWGRSIIGGCLFVVLKDTLLLYSRYRLARDHRKRKVLNYDRKRGEAVSQ